MYDVIPSCRAFKTMFCFPHVREYSRCTAFSLKEVRPPFFVRIFRLSSIHASRHVGAENCPSFAPGLHCRLIVVGKSSLLPSSSKLCKSASQSRTSLTLAACFLAASCPELPN